MCPTSSGDANGATRPSSGRPASGRCIYEPYRHSVISTADDPTRLILGGIPTGARLRVPAGMARAKNPATKQLHLRTSSTFARRFRRVFGRVGEIQLAAEARGGGEDSGGPISRGALPLLNLWCFRCRICTAALSCAICDMYGIQGPCYHLAPTHLPIICLPHWMYGSLGEKWGDSFVCARIIAFSSRADFPCADQMIALGDPVV